MKEGQTDPGGALTRKTILGARETLDLLGEYYPPERVSVKTQYLIEGLFQEGAI